MQENQNRRGLTGAHIKWIAIVCMFIDHIGAAVLEPILLNTAVTAQNLNQMQLLYDVDRVLRAIGRFSFPAFCFLLTEGFWYTRNRARYLGNLMLFAVVSEIPFDLAVGDGLWDLSSQNVFFTLFLGLIAIWTAEYWLKRAMAYPQQVLMCQVFAAAAAVGFAALAEALHTDYGAAGVCVIFVMYILRRTPVFGALAGWGLLTVTNWMEIYCLPFVFAVKCYNGQRGKQVKYFFYMFYPAHLLILYFVRIMLLK